MRRSALAEQWLRAVEPIVGRHVGRAQIEVLATTDRHAVLLVRAGAARYVLKAALTGARPGLDYRRSATAQQWAAQAGVPVPEVVAAGVDPQAPAVQYLLHEHVDGVEWREVRPRLGAAELAEASADIARAVLGIQSVALPSFGVLGEAREESLVDALGARIELRIPAGPRRILAQRALESHAGLFAGPAARPVLTHDDLHHANLLFRESAGGRGRLAAVLDWDKSWAGAAESDVARMAFWDDMTDPVFWSVYRESVPALDGWERRAEVYQLLWCLEYDVDTPRHRQDTATLVARLT